MNILLVENDPMIYRHLESVLIAEGYHVLEREPGKMVDNYEDAVFLVDQHLVNLAILDIQLNGEKDGLQLGEYIHNYYPQTPFLFLTGFTSVSNAIRAAELGAKDMLDKLEKPFTESQLKRKLLLLRPAMEAVTRFRRSAAVFNVVDADAPPNHAFFARRVIQWENVVSITSYHPKTRKAVKNNFFFLMTDGKVYRCHESLRHAESFLPDYITRFNDTEMVNVKFIDQTGKSATVYYIGQERYEINEACFATAMQVIRRFILLNS